MFDEPVNPLTVNGESIVVSDGVNNSIPCTVNFSENNKNVLIMLHNPLASDNQMSITIDGVEDRAGNEVMAQTTQFATGTGPNTKSPVIVRKSPNNGATDVPVNTVIVYEIDEPIDSATVNSNSFIVRDESTRKSVLGSYSVSQDAMIIRFVPDESFAVGRRYGVLTASQGITDLSGNRIPGRRGSLDTFTVGFEEDTIKPKLVGVSPSDGQTDVPVNSRMVIVFDEPVNGANVQKVTLSVGNEITEVKRSLSNGNRVLTLTPLTLLKPLTEYTVTIEDIKDISGNLMDGVVVSNFTTETGVDLLKPAVAFVNPKNGSTDVPTNVAVTVKFNKSIIPLTVTSETFTLLKNNTSNQIPGTITVSDDFLSATFTPDNLLDKSTQYNVRISGVFDITGQTASLSSGFTTGLVKDLDAPFVLDVSPPDGSSNVNVNSKIIIQLNETLNEFSIDNSDVIVSDGVDTVFGLLGVSFDKRSLTFTPFNPLSTNTIYTIEVDGFADLIGNPVTPFMSSFTTKGSDVPDFIRPSVASVGPLNGATGVDVNTQIVWAFSETINPVTVNNSSIKVFVLSNQDLIAGDYTVNGGNVTFTPTTQLPGGVLVQTEVNWQLEDLAGNSSNFFSSTFFTEGVDDITVPEVVKVTPGDGEEDIGPNAKVVITFSESLKSNTINGNNFALFVGSKMLPTNLSRSSDNRTVTLSSTLPSASVVTVVVTNDVMDLSGNSLIDFQTKFSTTDFDVIHPSVVNQRPGNSASEVAIDTSIVLYVNEALDVSTIPAALHVAQNGKLVDITFTVNDNGRTIEVVPNIPFENDAFIEVFLDVKARDLFGNTLNNYQGQFRTVADDASTTAPFVLRINPVSNSTGVPLNTLVDIEFNEALDIATVASDTVKLKQNISGSPEIPGTITLEQGGHVIRIVPDNPLVIGKSHFYEITNGIKDLDGNAPSFSTFKRFFTTGDIEDKIPPGIVSVTPPNGTTEIGVNTNIRVMFDEPVNPLTVNAESIVVNDGINDSLPCTINFSDNNKDVLIVLHSPLASDSQISITIDGVEGHAGNSVIAQTTQFTTGTGPDTKSPGIVRRSPNNGATDVPVNAVIVYEIDEPIDPATVNSNSFLVKDDSTGQSVLGIYSFSQDARIIRFVPDAPFALGERYSVYTASRGITDLSGNMIPGSTRIVDRFTVGLEEDTIKPELVGVIPSDGQTDVPINAKVDMVFNEPVNEANLYQVTLSSENVIVEVKRNLSNGNRTLTLNPLTLLKPLSLYTVTIDGIEDISGNLMDGNVTVSFTTETGVDLVKPAIELIDPDNSATDVPTNTKLFVRFNKSINPLTLNDETFRLFKSNTSQQITGNITVTDDGLGAVFIPDNLLTESSGYRVQISDLKDFIGNTMPFFSSFFNTGIGVDFVQPTIVDILPFDGAADVADDVSITVNISDTISVFSVEDDSITVSDNGLPVNGSTTVNVDRRSLTFVPVNVLTPDTTFTVDVGGFTDLAGNDVIPFASSFTTKGGGSISGTILDENSKPVAGVIVNVFDFNSGLPIKDSLTDVNGNYIISQLPDGEYIVFANAVNTNFASEYYDDVTDFSQASPVRVTDPDDTPGIDFILKTKGSISGTVLDSNNQPIGGVRVEAYEVNGSFVNSAITDFSGKYTIDSLLDGDYLIRASAFQLNLISEYYDNVIARSDAEAVSVIQSGDTLNIDFVLEAGGSISGTVLDENNQIVSGIRITAYDFDTNFFAGSAITDFFGNYVISDLVSGNYKVFVEGGWDNLRC